MLLKELAKTIFKALKPLKTTDFDDLLSVADTLQEDTKTDNYQVHFLWVEGTLSTLELLCINSFAKNGFDVILWHYGDITNPPENVSLKDGRELINEDRIFTYSNGSLAGFADLFRYKVLSVYGGIWADTDVICLTSKKQFSQNKQPILVSEKLNGIIKVNNNFIFWPNPIKGDFIDLAYSFSDAFLPDKQYWGDCGPKLLHSLAINYPHLTPRIMSPSFCNPFEHTKCPSILITPNTKIAESTLFLHCYNETWRRNKVDKNASFPESSIIGRLSKLYL
ncbi:glycosyltransferase [Alteromonas lipolytica]|uniref:Alpha 1,4-glycosyltransferase domain-containing protein n=1 Tax=Alteromonas lipolytica TaxID=1856405 RepID=A0A1E8FDS0_9ALTE|nr:glycosyltransferase [Alteromonas lipolytica]OFI34070.1 hypothetical protein BFC17_21210 [Alteromonas lipolytica]GGF65683.1 hypothetical protein GCM10011338_17540 [Alteromonas lipolytica]